MAIAFLNNITFSGGSQAEKLRLENLAADPAQEIKTCIFLTVQAGLI
jgi:hypothetical protein